AHLNAHLAKILDEIVGKRIVIIDDKQHLRRKLNGTLAFYIYYLPQSLYHNHATVRGRYMPQKMLSLALLFILIGSAAGQTATPAKPADDTAKLEKDAVELLRETSIDVGRLRTLENRISFNSELASLMWFHDDKEARAMYGQVVAEFK